MIDRENVEERLMVVSGVRKLEGQLNIDPKNADLYILLGNFYIQRRQTKAAEEAFLEAIDIDPQNIKPYMILANFYDAIHRKDDALAVYRKALDLKADDIRQDLAWEAQRRSGERRLRRPHGQGRNTHRQT